MSPERWREIERIYGVALERLPREREAFLKNECHGDEDLRLEVHSLLRGAASAENFLDEPAVEVAAQVMSQPEAPAMPGTIGRYRVTGKLGEGGMGLVYEAVDGPSRPADRVKSHPSEHRRQLARERFWREARLAASVNHPHICQIYEVGEVDQQLFIAMERLDGEPLSARLHRGAVPLADAVPTGLEVLGPLDALHVRGIVHRDLKPSNIFLTRHGSRAKPNRFAAQMNRPVVAIVLEPDVASVFDSSAKVNAQLRSVIAKRRAGTQSSRVRGHRRKAG